VVRGVQTVLGEVHEPGQADLYLLSAALLRGQFVPYHLIYARSAPGLAINCQ
jgi:hypothetical protein